MTSLRASQRSSPVTAVLGPTNTGKTHLAVERMLAHGGGMIGLPLRLLAREIYDRVRLRAGDHAVALVTGEEKIIPAQPRYWVCTVEAMPPGVDVPFLAIDEIQLANDLERGHIFTDRILHRRGIDETMLLGASTMRGILEKLLPRTNFVSRPRLSKLTYAGQKKLTRLPRRSAIVAFSAEMVYTVAELIRRQQGGAAVVMGALSPRTRNAQVSLYQSGDVDYIVATDAIGMGLNMDVDHVAFASTRKFDGFQYRHLTPAELGQVAGRAGRFLNDGTFGVSGEAEPFEQEVIDRLENHNFDSVRVLQWRNRELDFRSLDTLRKSLGYLPKQEGLTRAQNAADVEALEAVCRDESVRSLVSSAADVERAWEACQIPDYRNISPAEHAHLVGRVITFLQSGKGYIPEEWFSQQLAHCDNIEGGIDTLSTRISHVRTWTFIANRSDWLEAPLYWQGRAKEIEDRLSDVLHERLTHRFIDRKTSVLMRRLAKKEGLMSSVEEDGVIAVEGEAIGKIAGLSFVADPAVAGSETRLLKTAAVQALAAEVTARAKSLSATADTELKLSRLGFIEWQGHPVGRLVAADARFRPRAEVIADDVLPPTDRELVRERLQKFAERQIAALIEPLMKLEEAEGFEGLTRGIAYRLAENYGVLPREGVAEEVKQLGQDDRAKLRALGVRFGAFTLFLPALLKPAATDVRLVLWWLEQQKQGTVSGDVLESSRRIVGVRPRDRVRATTRAGDRLVFALDAAEMVAWVRSGVVRRRVDQRAVVVSGVRRQLAEDVVRAVIGHGTEARVRDQPRLLCRRVARDHEAVARRGEEVVVVVGERYNPAVAPSTHRLARHAPARVVGAAHASGNLARPRDRRFERAVIRVGQRLTAGGFDGLDVAGRRSGAGWVIRIRQSAVG